MAKLTILPNSAETAHFSGIYYIPENEPFLHSFSTSFCERSINSDLQRGLDRRLRHTQHRTQNRTSEPLKHQRTTNTTTTLVVKY